MVDVDLVAHIEQHPGAKPAELAQRFGMSVRTLRTRINDINAALAGRARIVLTRGAGYSLAIEDADGLSAWCCRAEEGQAAFLPSGSDERASYLLNYLLMNTGWTRLEDLSSILFVSRSALSGDIKRVESVLTEFDLALERRPRYGMRVIGSELNRRLCLANAMMGDAGATESAPSHGGGGTDSAAHRVIDTIARKRQSTSRRDLLEVVERCVRTVVADDSFRINSAAYQNLLVHIAVALMRIQEGCYVPIDSERLEYLRTSRAYDLARDVADAIARELGIELPSEEVAYISIHLAGKQTLAASPSAQDDVVISDEVWDAVSKMLERVWQTFRFDFRSDLELRMNLACHVVPLAVRLRYHMKLKNPLLDEIKMRYPLAYSMAGEASTILSSLYGARLSDDELGYIALTFALALERQKSETPRKNVLVVCASGAGSARLLEYRCRQEFGAYVNSVVSCDVLHIDRIDFSTIDYVFTTVPIGRHLPVPVREVKYFLRDVKEVEDVRALLSRPAAEGGFARYFDESLFLPHVQASSKRDALEALIAHVAERKEVSRDFGALVWEREHLMATSLGNLVAMPHPIRASSSDSFACVALLDEPLVWDELGQQVQAVFLMSFAQDAGAEQHDVLEVLARLMVSPSGIRRLLSERTHACLLKLLASFGADDVPACASTGVAENLSHDVNAAAADKAVDGTVDDP